MNERLTLFQNNYDSALAAKSTVDTQIARNLAMYNGANFSRSGETNTNTITMKDTKRAVEGLLPQLIEPFVSTEEAILAEPKEYTGVEGAKLHTAMLNEELNQLDKAVFFETLGRTLIVEGTVWLRAGWKDGRATGYVCENDCVFPDPSAKLHKDMRFLVYRRRVSKSTIRDNEEWYGAGAYEKVKGSAFDATSSADRNAVAKLDQDAHGYDDSFNFEQGDDRTLVDTFEYYGFDDDGKPVLAIWVDDEMLRDTESPFPNNPIPFASKPYMQVPHSLWGSGLPELIEDHQEIRSRIMGGILDNMSLANNGQKFIQKGAMDYTNWKRMKNGNKFIQVNKLPSQAIEEGSFNPIAPSTFQLFETFQLDEESLTGVTRFTQGNDPRALNSTARGIQTLSGMAHQRTLHTVRIVSAVVENMCEIWANFNIEFLEQSQIVNIAGKWTPFARDELSAKLNISITVGTAGVNEAKTQSIMMMIQLAQDPKSGITPERVSEMVAMLAEINNLPSVARGIRVDAQKAKSPEAQQAQQAQMQQEQQKQNLMIGQEMQESQAKVAKDMASANLDMAKAEDLDRDNQLKVLQAIT